MSDSPTHPGMPKMFWIEPVERPATQVVVNVPHLVLNGSVGSNRWSVTVPEHGGLLVAGHRVQWWLHKQVGAYEKRMLGKLV